MQTECRAWGEQRNQLRGDCARSTQGGAGPLSLRRGQKRRARPGGDSAGADQASPGCSPCPVWPDVVLGSGTQSAARAWEPNAAKPVLGARLGGWGGGVTASSAAREPGGPAGSQTVLGQPAHPLHPGVGPQGVLEHEVPEHLHPRVVLWQVVVVLGSNLPHLQRAWQGQRPRPGARLPATHMHGGTRACTQPCVGACARAHADTHTQRHRPASPALSCPPAPPASADTRPPPHRPPPSVSASHFPVAWGTPLPLASCPLCTHTLSPPPPGSPPSLSTYMRTPTAARQLPGMPFTPPRGMRPVLRACFTAEDGGSGEQTPCLRQERGALT